MTLHRIQLLSPIIANQIAAGEVVERPASVIKELVENSIDAGADNIEVSIEKGGCRLIRVIDNGKGIHRDDLKLALSRHATSKIAVSEDLAAIHSLGFRGEALASICSIARLKLTSRTKDADQAFMAEAKGDDMDVTVVPANLEQGTMVEVQDLFFNTPARRRFLKSTKTEFQHIENRLHQLMLSHPEVSFRLSHNGKLIKHLPGGDSQQDHEKRIASILGQAFIAKAIYFEVSYENIQLRGWLGNQHYHRSQNDSQYVFINGRAIRDRVINHAIRVAYEDVIPANRLAGYVLYLEMDPGSLDVNVHPTKHEVRFQQGRMVHDFLTRAVIQVLHEGQPLFPDDDKGAVDSVDFPDDHLALVNEDQSRYTVSNNPIGKEKTPHNHSSAMSGAILFRHFGLIALNQCCSVIDIPKFTGQIFDLWLNAVKSEQIRVKKIMFPEAIEFGRKAENILELTDAQKERFSQITKLLGIEIGFSSNELMRLTEPLLKAEQESLIPFLNGINRDRVIQDLLTVFCGTEESPAVDGMKLLKAIKTSYINHQENWTYFVKWLGGRDVEVLQKWLNQLQKTLVDSSVSWFYNLDESDIESLFESISSQQITDFGAVIS